MRPPSTAKSTPANQRPIKFVHEPQSLFGVGRNHGSWSRPGRHRVDPDPVGPQLLARRPDQPKNRVLRHDVVCNPHAAARGRRAGRADDAPPHAPLHHRPRRVLHAHRHPSRVDADKPVEQGEVETNETTVHRQINAGDKRRLVGSQEQDGVSHVLGVWRYAFQANQRPIKFVHEPQSLFGVGRNHGSWSRPGRHRVDPDPVGPQLLARRPDQPKNRVLRHDVVCNPHAAARGRRAGRADDAPPHAPLHHRPRRVLHAHRHPSRVDADKPVEQGEVEPAVLLDRPIYHGLHLLFLANVALYKAALVEADGLRHGDALLDLDVGDDHAECAMIGKKASGRFPDAASTAGHYHNFALEPPHARI
nr:hypothetical protein Iba_contig2043CG0010 [Ipomoea batatas]